MIRPPHILQLPSPGATARLAEKIGALLRPGDCLLLDGPIGAGKTHFARHLIQSLMSAPEDVPSPTFTLVQTYDTDAGEIWHADLYRLSSLDEIEELGLTEAFGAAICLVEWPEKLGPLAPAGALWLRFATDSARTDMRYLTLDWTGPDWGPRLEHLLHD